MNEDVQNIAKHHSASLRLTLRLTPESLFILFWMKSEGGACKGTMDQELERREPEQQAKHTKLYLDLFTPGAKGRFDNSGFSAEGTLIYKCVCNTTSRNVFRCLHTHTHTHAHAHTHTHARARARTHARTHIHARTHARTHAHSQTHTHAHTHARTHTPLKLRECSSCVQPMSETSQKMVH